MRDGSEVPLNCDNQVAGTLTRGSKLGRVSGSHNPQINPVRPDTRGAARAGSCAKRSKASTRRRSKGSRSEGTTRPRRTAEQTVQVACSYSRQMSNEIKG